MILSNGFAAGPFLLQGERAFTFSYRMTQYCSCIRKRILIIMEVNPIKIYFFPFRFVSEYFANVYRAMEG
jgi:hypothetical protein